MPIVVEKSPNILFDSNTTAALEHVLNTLNRQPEQVKSVSVLANFSVDTEAALVHNLPLVVQGLVVQTTKDYILNEEDQSWFHPHVSKGRSVYAVDSPIGKSALMQLSFNTSGNSVGEYSLTTHDEFGCEQVQHRIVVDVSSEDTFRDSYQQWLQTGITAGELDAEWKRMKIDNTYSIVSHTEGERQRIMDTLTSNASLLHSDMTHGVLSDLASVYFVNAAVKHSSSILMNSSSLAGYRMYNTHDKKHKFYPSNLGKSESYYAWDELSKQTCAKITDTCFWKGDLKANAQVMRTPTVKSPKNMESSCNISLTDSFKMRHCVFSPSDNFIDKLNPVDILRITPNSTQDRDASDSMSAPLSMEHPILQKLMRNIEDIQTKFPEFVLFNPKVVSGGRIVLPREIYKHVL